MNYYQHHIGDYTRDTAHLTLAEDGAYRRMLDLYYASEKPLTSDRAALYRVLRARSKDEKEAVDTVLAEFFSEESDGWHQRRCDAEVQKMQEKSGKARASASKRWQSEGNASEDANAMRTHSEGNAPNTHNPIPNTQKKEAPRGSRLLLDALPDEWKAFCLAERKDLIPERVFADFSDYWKAKPGKDGVKLDWLATWRKWVRNSRAAPGVNVSAPVADGKITCRTCGTRTSSYTSGQCDPCWRGVVNPGGARA